ncbi:Hypothetical predicted protein [Paramuricea clavata]|uniref:Uncharacterized protein n=1 Tax=Paramuricea clavata TaxID=317549 RepID=A0A6S7JD07_PARCT|nr:Hypothetical predicted protein [Paramuricea clavata]
MDDILEKEGNKQVLEGFLDSSVFQRTLEEAPILSDVESPSDTESRVNLEQQMGGLPVTGEFTPSSEELPQPARGLPDMSELAPSLEELPQPVRGLPDMSELAPSLEEPPALSLLQAWNQAVKQKVNPSLMKPWKVAAWERQ